jgi:hypothetical protein
MPSDLTPVGAILSPPALLSADDLDRQRVLDDEYGRLAQVAAMIAGQRASLKAQQEKFGWAYRQAQHPKVAAALLHHQAAEMAATEEKVAHVMRPVFDNLWQIAAQTIPDDKINRAIRRYAEEAIDIGVSWLELIQNARIQWLKLASDKMKESGKIDPVISSADELEHALASLSSDER